MSSGHCQALVEPILDLAKAFISGFCLVGEWRESLIVRGPGPWRRKFWEFGEGENVVCQVRCQVRFKIGPREVDVDANLWDLSDEKSFYSVA